MVNIDSADKSKSKPRRKPPGKPFEKGNRANPSGRPKGLKNKKTLQIEAMLEKLGCNPIENMVTMLKDVNVDNAIKCKLNCELANYIYPKRKAIEHAGPGGGPVVLYMPNKAADCM